MINNGDIFITKLERDFYGAFRIIKTKGELDFLEDEVFLIAITSYIDKEKPKITDKRLTEYLIEKRFFFDNTPNIKIYAGRIIEKQFEYLGNIPLTQKEEKLKIKVGDGKNGGFPLCGQVQKDFGYQAFLEWRWQNENELMKKEHEEQSKKVEEFYKNRIMKPKKMMEDEQFWEIISLFDWQKLGTP